MDINIFKKAFHAYSATFRNYKPKLRVAIIGSQDSSDNRIVEKLEKILKDSGINTWSTANPGLNPDVNLAAEFAIEEAHIILIIASQFSTTRGGDHIRYLNHALDVSAGSLDNSIHVIVIAVENCTLPNAFRGKKPLIAFGNEADSQIQRLPLAFVKKWNQCNQNGDHPKISPHSIVKW